jgi:hypothetical protein
LFQETPEAAFFNKLLGRNMRRFKQLWMRARMYSDLTEEIQQHLNEKREALIPEGMSPEEAESSARLAFGNERGIEALGRDEWM